MTRTSFAAGLVGLLVLALCAATAAGVVVAVRWLLDQVWPTTGPNAQLAFGLVAPVGVVLFGVLVERADAWTTRRLS